MHPCLLRPPPFSPCAQAAPAAAAPPAAHPTCLPVQAAVDRSATTAPIATNFIVEVPATELSSEVIRGRRLRQVGGHCSWGWGWVGLGLGGGRGAAGRERVRCIRGRARQERGGVHAGPPRPPACTSWTDPLPPALAPRPTPRRPTPRSSPPPAWPSPPPRPRWSRCLPPRPEAAPLAPPLPPLLGCARALEEPRARRAWVRAGASPPAPHHVMHSSKTASVSRSARAGRWSACVPLGCPASVEPHKTQPATACLNIAPSTAPLLSSGTSDPRSQVS